MKLYICKFFFLLYIRIHRTVICDTFSLFSFYLSFSFLYLPFFMLLKVTVIGQHKSRDRCVKEILLL